MNPGGDHVLDWFSCPLWGHMSDTFDGDEVKTIVFFDKARYLSIGLPWSPGFLDFPAECLDPSLGTIGGDSSIGISGVMHHLDTVILEDSVDPLRTLLLIVIVRTNFARAFLINFNLVRDMESSSKFFTVNVVSDG